MNAKHNNIKFTFETEENGKLSFLDTLIINDNGKLSTTVYRKPTYTGLGLNYLSFIPHIFQLNSIKTLLNRAYNLCSTYEHFDEEVNKLREYFLRNSYLSFLFDRILRQFLNNKYSLKDRLTTVRKDVRYFKFPFLGHHSYVIRKRLQTVLKHTFPQIDFTIIFTNDFTVGSVLQKTKEKPFNLTSNVVYMFSCPCCIARYIGSCTRWLSHRCT